MSSLSRTLSLPCQLPSFLPDLKTETADQSSEMEDVALTTDFITQSVNEHSGKVQIVRSFHEHQLILSTMSSPSRSLSSPSQSLLSEMDDVSSEMDVVSSLSSSLSSSSTKISKTQKSTMSSLSRFPSLPCQLPSFLPDLKTQTADRSSEMEDVALTTDFITQSVNEHSGKVEIYRFFHKHPLILSTYLNVNEKVDEFNFCCICNIYFTVGVPIYSCFKCYLFLHQSCAELPKWIDSTQHPQHRLRLTLTDTNEDCISTSYRYECRICDYDIDIKDAVQSIPISLFKNSYLNRLSSSLPLYLKNKTTPQKVEDVSIMVSRKVDQIDHFFHKHTLILSTYVNVNEIEEENEWCHLCEYYIKKVESIYSCYECNFFLHESCARLPQLIKSTLHPQHLLHFRLPTEEDFTCDKCDECIDRSPRYTCHFCDFDLHFECVLDNYSNSLFKSRRLHLSLKSTSPSLSRSPSFPMDGKRNSQIIFSEPPPNVQGISLTISSFFNFQIQNVDQIRHFFHKHPLAFMIFKIEYQNRLPDCCCKICNDEFLPDVPIYGCHECDFYLHKSCAKLPQTMRITWHPAHMLELIQIGRYNLAEEANCQICQSETLENSNYCYCCTDCRVYFDWKCASTHKFEDHKEQEHTFHFFKASLFACDACGITENKELVSSVCTKCPLQVHVRCSNSFPRTVKQIRHHHKLKLTYSCEIDSNYANETCRICFNQMNNVYCMYQCIDSTNCTYIAHVSCATSKEIVEHEWIENKTEEFVTREDVEGNQVKHFSHYHDLVFTNKEPMLDAYCDACVSPISAPFYACAIDECNFYLHKQCFELPLEIQHPLHQHPLTLTSYEDFFRCYGCRFLCNGFIYSCTRGCCQFNLDVRCSLLSHTLKHDAHECTLTLIDYKYVRRDEDSTALNTRKCSACDGDGDSQDSCMFSCRRCNFHLDLGCALLPKQVTHECPNHNWKARPLELTYGGVEDKSGEYYCDGCEESRCIRNWFYDCGDCVWSNHPQCVLGNFQFKYGKTYQIRRHSHKVELVKKDPVRYRVYSCDRCKKPLTDDSPLFCAQCNLYFHLDCS